MLFLTREMFHIFAYLCSVCDVFAQQLYNNYDSDLSVQHMSDDMVGVGGDMVMELLTSHTTAIAAIRCSFIAH